MWRCGHDPLVGHAHNLANDQVGALRIQLWVVAIEHVETDVVLMGQAYTGVIFLDSMGTLAMHCRRLQAQRLPWHKIIADRVDFRIQTCKLIGGNVICL